MRAPATREQELLAAIYEAEITPSDFRVFMTLLRAADFGTAEIPDRFQPRSLVKLAEKCHISLAGLKRSVSHLQQHGWLERHRNLTSSGVGGRGHPTRYVLLVGKDCDCKPAQREPVSGKKAAQAEPINRLTTSRIGAVQQPFGDERAVRGEVGWGGWPEGSEGDWANRPSALCSVRRSSPGRWCLRRERQCRAACGHPP